MAYKDNYLKYFESIPAAIEKCEQTGSRLAFGYTSDLDAIATCDEATLNVLIDKYLKEEPSYVEEEAIQDMSDFVRIISYFAMNGLGGEVDIASEAVVDELKQSFDMMYSLGGTCAQSTGALAAIGVPVLTHFTDQSEEVLTSVNFNGVESTKDGEKVPLTDCVSGELPLLHIIMQYNRGDVLKIHGKEYVIPVSNRLIMQFDEVHKSMPVREEFMQYVEENAKKIYAYSISGFNAILDMEIMEERAAQIKEHLVKIKEKNPDVMVYFESAHYISTKIRDYLYSVLSDNLDIMGMNEEELVHLTKKMAHPVDKDELDSIISGLDYILEQYPVKGIVMHSKDYSLYYGAEQAKIDIEKGLTLGNLMSGTRARVGRYGTLEDCRENLKLELSPVGVEFAERLEKMNTKHAAVLVPSRYMEKPNFTIGLGDTFVAGVQLCFVK